MPKENSKKGKRKKTAKDGDTEALTEKKSKAAKKNNPRIEDEIGMSKQLTQKLRTSTRRAPKNSKHPQPRMSANGKLMPSLAELERMFEGSDDDDDVEDTRPVAPPSPLRCKTPDQPIIPDPKSLLTPKTIQEISNKMLELISTLPDVNRSPDDTPPLPVVPQELKHKKNGEPYILGCNERAKIPDAPSTAIIGNAWDKYGINYNFKREEDDIELSSKQSKGCGSLSKSIFNPKSEEIASMLESAEILSDGSVDSNKTLPYEYSALSPNSKQRTFSPLPSTSKDNETFLKNDLRFNESLLGDSVSNDSSQSALEIIELPCETIMVDDDSPDINIVSSHDVKVEEVRYHAPTFDSFLEDDLYSSIIIDVDETYHKDDCEIIDVDEVLAGNKNIIDKYKKQSNANTVTHVETSTSTEANRLHPKEEPIVVEDYNPVISTRDEIESVVTNFFKHQPPNNARPDPVLNSETIDLSETSTEPSTFKTIMDSFLNCTKSLMDTWRNNNLPKSTSLTRKRKLRSPPVVIDTIDLDQTHLNDSSVQIVDNSMLCNQANGEQSSNFRNTPNDNSVIIVGNVDVTSTNVEKKKKPRKSKKNPVIAEPMVQSPVGAKTPPGRTIGDCPICMDNLSNNAIASTICGHIFCMRCIQAAVKASGKRCPTCRKVLKGVGYHQLFL